MSNLRETLSGCQTGTASAADQLLPLVYDELRAMAGRKLADEKPGQTLQATALVHEAYLRLVGPDTKPQFNSHGHFFAAAAEAMRRILVENARRKQAVKRGGKGQRIELDPKLFSDSKNSFELLELNDVLDCLAQKNPQAAEVVKLRFFAGLTGDQAAAVLNVSPGKADVLWSYARAWLFDRLNRCQEG